MLRKCLNFLIKWKKDLSVAADKTIRTKLTMKLPEVSKYAKMPSVGELFPKFDFKRELKIHCWASEMSSANTDTHLLIFSKRMEEQIYSWRCFMMTSSALWTCLKNGGLRVRRTDQNTHEHKHGWVNAVPDLLVEFGVWGSLVDEQFDDMFVSLPRSQMERVAALVVGDVGQGLVS